MGRVVVVVPSIVPAVTLGCLATIHPDILKPEDLPAPPTRQRSSWVSTVDGTAWHDGKPDVRLMVVWNTPEHNAGVAGSWNVGRDAVLSSEADWLIVLSAAVRFGREGMRDFLRALDACPTELVLEADRGLGWHVIAFSREVLEKIGPFDPIFFPAYSEDLDYSIRFQRAYDCDTHAPGWVGPLWPKVPVDASLIEIAHGIKRGGVTVDLAGMHALLDAKWGTQEEFLTPYNRDDLDWTYVGQPPPPL